MYRNLFEFGEKWKNTWQVDAARSSVHRNSSLDLCKLWILKIFELLDENFKRSVEETFVTICIQSAVPIIEVKKFM